MQEVVQFYRRSVGVCHQLLQAVHLCWEKCWCSVGKMCRLSHLQHQWQTRIDRLIFSGNSSPSSLRHVLQCGVSVIPHLWSCVPKRVLPSFSLVSTSATSLARYFECKFFLACFICELLISLSPSLERHFEGLWTSYDIAKSNANKRKFPGPNGWGQDLD